MQLPEPVESREFENVLPLINVVFLILIFFMLAGSFSTPDYFSVKAPLADNDTPADRQTLTILVNAAGELAVGSVPYTDEGLRLMLREQGQQHEVRPPLQLKADAAVVSRRLLALMQMLAEEGWQTLQLITVAGE